MKTLIYTLLLCLLFGSLHPLVAQTYSSGMVPLKTEVGTSAQFDIDVNTNLVTLTLVGPSTRWFGIGLDVNQSAMVSGTDCIYVSDGVLVDAQIVGFRRPVDDTDQNWTEISNTITNGIRTVIATRPLDSPDSSDYDFSTNPSSLGIIYANGRSATSSTISGHNGDENAGATTVSFQLLNIDEKFAGKFKINPNPTVDFLSISLPTEIKSGTLFITDFTGKTVLSKPLERLTQRMDISYLESGIYLINFKTSLGKLSKKVMKL